MSEYTLRPQHEAGRGHDVIVDGYRVGRVVPRGERFVAAVDDSLFNGPGLPGRSPDEVGDFESLEQAAEQLTDYIHRPHLGSFEAAPLASTAAAGAELEI